MVIVSDVDLRVGGLIGKLGVNHAGNAFQALADAPDDLLYGLEFVALQWRDVVLLDVFQAVANLLELLLGTADLRTVVGVPQGSPRLSRIFAGFEAWQ